MTGAIMSSEKQYEQEHEEYLYKEAHIISVELGYQGSWDQFMEDFSLMIVERNLRLRGDKNDG